MAGNKLSNVRSFSILQSGEGSTSFNNHNSPDFSGEKKSMKNFRVSIFFLNTRKNFKSNLVLVVVPVLLSSCLKVSNVWRFGFFELLIFEPLKQEPPAVAQTSFRHSKQQDKDNKTTFNCFT